MLSGSAKKLLPLVVAVGLAWFWLQPAERAPVSGPAPSPQPVVQAVGADDAVQQAFAARSRDVWLDAHGTVERNLADDRDGSAHQRFIIRTDGGISLLIAHNIDLAPRLHGLAVGDRISARGEYVWNDKGGVLHWTHHDPAGRLAGGHILWKGHRYE